MIETIRETKASGCRVGASWDVLFAKAHAEGQARLLYKDRPTEENKAKLDEAIADHEQYRKVCLEADFMIGMEQIFMDAFSGRV